MNQRQNNFFLMLSKCTHVFSWISLFLSIFCFFVSFWELTQKQMLLKPFLVLPLFTSFSFLLVSISFINIIYRPSFILYKFLGLVCVLLSALEFFVIFLNEKGGGFPYNFQFEILPHFIEALSYFFLGMIFVLWSPKLRNVIFKGSINVICLIVFFLSFEGVVIYLLPLQFKSLALFLPYNFISAVILAFISLSILLWSLYQDWLFGFKIAKWVPVIVSGCILIFNLFFMSTLFQQKQKYFIELSRSKGTEILWSVNQSLNIVVNILEGWGSRISLDSTLKEFNLNVESNLVFSIEPSISNIGLMDDDFNVLQQVSADKVSLYVPPAIKGAVGNFSPVFAVINSENHRLMLFKSIQTKDQKIKIAFFELDLHKFFQDCFNKFDLSEYDVNLSLDNVAVYEIQKPLDSLDKRYAFEENLPFLNLNFNLKITPIKNLVRLSWINVLIYVWAIAGLFGSILTIICIYLLQLLFVKNNSLIFRQKQGETLAEILLEVNKEENIQIAAQKILNILHENFHWQVLVYWQRNPITEQLQLRNVCKVSGFECPNFEKACTTAQIEILDFVDRSLNSDHLFWFSDYGNEKFERSLAAKQDNIRGCFGVYFYDQQKLVGALELFQTELFYPDQQMYSLHWLANIANQFSHYIERSELTLISKQLNAIFDSSFDAIYLLDLDLRIMQWNLAAEKMFGWTAEEIKGKSVKILIPEDRSEELINFKYILESTACGKHYQTQRKTKDGKLIWVSILNSPVYDIGNVLRAISVIVEDISERIVLERNKDEFISMISHELRTPLTSIIGALGILKESKEIKGELLELALLADRNATRMTMIIRDLLDIEKIQLGKFQVEMKKVFLAKAIKEAVAQCESFASNYQITIKVEKLLEDIQVIGDFSRIIQVVSNLLSNAVKFSNKGSTVEVFMEVIDSTVRVSVKDFGIGISENFKPRVFQKFTQALTGDIKIAGTGLGLNICKSLLTRMGASINFISQEGKGSTFYFDFPIAKD